MQYVLCMLYVNKDSSANTQRGTWTKTDEFYFISSSIFIRFNSYRIKATNKDRAEKRKSMGSRGDTKLVKR